jgi:PEP-CTERM motif
MVAIGTVGNRVHGSTGCAKNRKGRRQMKAIKGVCWFIVLGSLALPAMAGTVNMQFTGLPTGNNYFGVASYPYDMSVNGGPNQWMMCIGYNEHIEGWETWQANVASVGSLDLGTHLVDYEAAFLFRLGLTDQGANSNINAATWYLFEGTPGLTPEAAALVTLAQSQTYTQGEFGNVLLYSAIPGSENGNLGTAQDFLGTTPEPGTLAMFGSGFIGLAGVLRRKFKA